MRSVVGTSHSREGRGYSIDSVQAGVTRWIARFTVGLERSRLRTAAIVSAEPCQTAPLDDRRASAPRDCALSHRGTCDSGSSVAADCRIGREAVPRHSLRGAGRCQRLAVLALVRIACDDMASPSQERAWTALTSLLRQVSPSLDDERWMGGSHVRRLADNALPSLPLGHLERLRAQLELGAGGELAPTRTGKRRAHAPYSSAAFALNLFGRWLDDEERLIVCGLGDFEPELRLEHRLKIAHGGGTANLDVFVERDGLMLGVECKLTETLERHDAVGWKTPYLQPIMAELLSDHCAPSLTHRCQAHGSPSTSASSSSSSTLLRWHRSIEVKSSFSCTASGSPLTRRTSPRSVRTAPRSPSSSSASARTRSLACTFAGGRTCWPNGTTCPPPHGSARHIAELRARYDVAI